MVALLQQSWWVCFNKKQESRAIAGRTARCRCKFRYVSNFTISR